MKLFFLARLKIASTLFIIYLFGDHTLAAFIGKVMAWPRYRKQLFLRTKEFHSYWRDIAYFFLDNTPRTGHRLYFKCERLLFVVFFLCCPRRRWRRNTSNKGKATGITKINKASPSVTSSYPQTHVQWHYFKVKCILKEKNKKKINWLWLYI